jgi:peptidoglycan/xylan/chitin deacetylase (PgdA/CDA1 family)
VNINVWRHGPRSGAQVALTFDDGPNEPYTSRVLNILKGRGARATFFLVGENCLCFPAAARRIADEGHAVGNHSLRHAWWRCFVLRAAARRDLELAQEAISRATGVVPTLFRPPHGLCVPWLVAVAKRMGMDCVLWDVGTRDWQAARDSRRIVSAIVPRIRAGSIVLLHDGRETRRGYDRSQMLEALPLLLDSVEERGLELVTVPELLAGGESP